MFFRCLSYGYPPIPRDKRWSRNSTKVLPSSLEDRCVEDSVRRLRTLSPRVDSVPRGVRRNPSGLFWPLRSCSRRPLIHAADFPRVRVLSIQRLVRTCHRSADCTRSRRCRALALLPLFSCLRASVSWGDGIAISREASAIAPTRCAAGTIRAPIATAVGTSCGSERFA